MDKRTSVMIDNDVDKILRAYQAQYIKTNSCSCSYSKALNLILRKYILKK
jgi:hypothetical protein